MCPPGTEFPDLTLSFWNRWSWSPGWGMDCGGGEICKGCIFTPWKITRLSGIQLTSYTHGSFGTSATDLGASNTLNSSFFCLMVSSRLSLFAFKFLQHYIFLAIHLSRARWSLDWVWLQPFAGEGNQSLKCIRWWEPYLPSATDSFSVGARLQRWHGTSTPTRLPVCACLSSPRSPSLPLFPSLSLAMCPLCTRC